MIHILVTGANGQVGSELQYLSSQYPEFQFTFTDYTELDITREQVVNNYFKAISFDYCINCAAYTSVDQAENEVQKAQKINVTGVKNLATACQINATHLFHLSTDYVYHNHQNRPIVESDKTSPKSVYGKTKLEGERIAQHALSSTTIIRTSWVYSSFGKNFVKTMLRLSRERSELSVVFDQIGTPTYARALANAILDILRKAERENLQTTILSGIFHYSNEGVTSWYDFTKAIFELENISTPVVPIETKDYPTPAARPPFSLLNKAKIKATFDLEIPHWRESLKVCLKEMKQLKMSRLV
ncbi:MAG: dTDP-4-dehydrorhamnose reductase [Bacteroidota bacterium]